MLKRFSSNTSTLNHTVFVILENINAVECLHFLSGVIFYLSGFAYGNGGFCSSKACLVQILVNLTWIN